MRFTGTLGDDFPLPKGQPFTTAMAREAGISRWTLGALVSSGLLRRPVRGVYLATEIGDSLSLRAACLQLVAPPDCVVVDRHAGWLLGAQMVLAPGEHLDVRPLSLFRPSGAGRLRNGIARSGERWLRDTDVIEIEGLQVTTPIRTAWDLGRVRWPDEAISGLDAMHRLGAYDVDEFLAGIDQFRGQRWVRTLRAVGPLADGRSESPGESVLRLRCLQNRFAVVPQVVVTRGTTFIARLDLANEELLAGAEYDGVEWHPPEQREHDRKRREAVRGEDWLVEVFTKADLFTRTGDADGRIRRLHDRALRRRGRRIA